MATVENPFADLQDDRWPAQKRNALRKRRLAPLHKEGISLEADQVDWLKERADLLGVPFAALVRDVLRMFQNTVCSAERNGLVKELEPRTPGYLSIFRLSSVESSHLDDSPLALDEL